MNETYIERFEQAHCAEINKLFWLAGGIENEDLADIFEYYIDKETFLRLFPEAEYCTDDDPDPKDLIYTLVEIKKCGLLAEVHIPEALNFGYIDDKPIRWEIRRSTMHTRLVYAESLEELMLEIEKVAQEVFESCIAAEKKRVNNVEKS